MSPLESVPGCEVSNFSAVPSLVKEAAIFKLLGHPVRLRILELLQQRGRTDRQAWEPLGLGQTRISQQLTILKHLGIIEGKRSGSGMCYTICDPLAKRIMAVLHRHRE